MAVRQAMTVKEREALERAAVTAGFVTKATEKSA
jgi:hypothetical protein